ncbi:MAG: M24 family metallopeptidase [Planctomycetota bacterium]|jgi:Xaa-Pro aminopeptidase
MSATIAAEKVEQAVGILADLGLDAWMTFARETTESGDPVLPLILGHPVTWQSAFIVTRGGDRIAIVGKYEDEAVMSTGAWTEVMPYVQGLREPLREVLGRLDPARIAINYSTDDVKADGLTHGLYLLLREHLAGTPWLDRFESAGEVIRRLRGVKTSGEIERIRAAIAAGDRIFQEVADTLGPGTSEAEVAHFMHERADDRGLGMAWERSQCPIVTTGPGSMVGHGIPSPDLHIRPGNVFHLDFGVVHDGYCSDIQRAWYVPDGGEAFPPAAVKKGFDTIVRAIEAAAALVRPGAIGWEVDAAARKVIVDAGYPEYEHATGHHVGRAAHDGGGVIGPRWERYGRTPEFALEAGNVVTLELGIDELDGRGYLGLEEMALVTDDGYEWLSTPQRELPLLRHGDS